MRCTSTEAVPTCNLTHQNGTLWQECAKRKRPHHHNIILPRRWSNTAPTTLSHVRKMVPRSK
eukprot:scaffold1846_cov73-Cylindrotheca_fusiformis.AAC.2